MTVSHATVYEPDQHLHLHSALFPALTLQIDNERKSGGTDLYECNSQDTGLQYSFCVYSNRNEPMTVRTMAKIGMICQCSQGSQLPLHVALEVL